MNTKNQEMLFKEYKYFKYQFPVPQYLGSKHTLLRWIGKYIPKEIKVVLDAFGGTQSVAYYFKQLGFQVITNDFLSFCHQIGLALIENKNDKLTNEDINYIFCVHPTIAKDSLITNLFTDLFFIKKECEWLDNIRANINKLPKYKQALALSVINRSMTRKVTMGHFGHTQALSYANNPERIRRNRSLVRPLKDIFLELIPQYNQAIFDNRQENISYNQNILELLPKLKEIDMAYFDPPYCDSHADYQSFYHLLETYTEYWKDKQFINSIKRYEPQRYSGFDKKQEVVQSFKKLFDGAKDIQYWLLSYNNRSYPDIKDISQIIAKYKDYQIEFKTYENGRGGKGSVAGSREVLFICKNKPQWSIEFHMKIESFNHWKELYDSDKLDAFTTNASALLWLKIKSIIRKELLADFSGQYKINLSEKRLNRQFEELYNIFSKDITSAENRLDEFIRKKNREQIASLDAEKLVSELYKLRHFDWGGDYKNALDKYLVDRYIKVYQSYDELTSKFDSEINKAVRGYVLCSWYNHWASILIEYIFRSHPIVLATVGQIKKVDFFLNNIPFDLKVTYLPANFIEAKRRERGLSPELTELKQKAKQCKINFTLHKKSDDTYYEIVEKMKDRNDTFCLNALKEIKKVRLEILNEVKKNPKILIKNLYEEQGEMRFDSSNRLFLVLSDTEDLDNSWKLKRNLEALRPAIKKYLDEFDKKRIDDLKITFRYKNKDQDFTAYSDVIFIVK